MTDFQSPGNFTVSRILNLSNNPGNISEEYQYSWRANSNPRLDVTENISGRSIAMSNNPISDEQSVTEERANPRYEDGDEIYPMQAIYKDPRLSLHHHVAINGHMAHWQEPKPQPVNDSEQWNANFTPCAYKKDHEDATGCELDMGLAHSEKLACEEKEVIPETENEAVTNSPSNSAWDTGCPSAGARGKFLVLLYYQILHSVDCFVQNQLLAVSR